MIASRGRAATHPTLPMPLIFVYGSLKQGFANQHVNTGRRVAGRYRTRERHPLVLLGDGEVPCILATPGSGSQVIGELYEVDEGGMIRMDRLERLGEPDGYERVELSIERFDAAPVHTLTAWVYVKQEQALPASLRRVVLADEYRPEHAGRFRWRGKA